MSLHIPQRHDQPNMAGHRPGRFQSRYRVPLDFYTTPPEAVRALLSVEAFAGDIWEPACGHGAISKVFTEAGYDVVSTDLAHRGFGAGGIDFLRETKPRARNIVTNPPYGRGMGDQFIGHALRLTRQTGGAVAMLCDLASLCHPRRHGKFLSYPPTAIYALDHLVCLPNDDPQRAKHFAKADRRYCWMVWRHDHIGEPRFWWLSCREFRNPTPTFQFNIRSGRISP